MELLNHNGSSTVMNTSTNAQEEPDVIDAEETHEIQQHVKTLLHEMLAIEDADRDKSACEHALQSLLQACIIDDAHHLQLQELPKRMCAYEFKPGDIAWNCKVCQVDETCVMCNDCFIASDHDDHEVFFYYTQSGGCCDCGDTEAWSPDGFCTHHKGAQDANPLDLLPPNVLSRSRICLQLVMELVLETIHEARSAVVLNAQDLERVRDHMLMQQEEQPDTRFAVLIHYNELQVSQEYANALNRSHPAIAYQMLKIVGETSTQKQSLVRTRATATEALEIVEALQKNDIRCSVVSCSYKSRTLLVTSLLQWLVSLANLSDGLCRLICEQFFRAPMPRPNDQDVDMNTTDRLFPILQDVILADAFLPKHVSDALHSLLMALLADPLFKRSFAIAFTYTYRQLYREFVNGIGSASLTILAFGVQFFNRASFVKLLVDEYDVLQVLTTSVQDTLRKKLKAPATCMDPSAWQTLLTILSHSKSPYSSWDLLAAAIGRSDQSTISFPNAHLMAMETEAAQALGFAASCDQERVQQFLQCLVSSASATIELPGRFELDVGSPVFEYRRYMSGLLDLRYALQIEGISELYVTAHHGAYLIQFLHFMAYVQGIGAETRQVGDHVEMESRGWVVAVEFVSTISDVFAWIVTNVLKPVTRKHSDALECDDGLATNRQERLRELIVRMVRPWMDAYFFWLASSGKYFPPSAHFRVGDRLGLDQVETHVSCHFPLHRALAQVLRTLCDCPDGLEILYEVLLRDPTVWVHDKTTSSLGFWHRVMLIEPVLQSIVWDAQVHAGLWIRNGMSVVNHSMNYGEPPFCLRFRDLDVLLLQFSCQLMGVEWTTKSILERFRVDEWYDVSCAEVKDAELMVTECLTLLSQLASELPPKVHSNDPLRSLVPYLRRELVQRLCVGPCAHSDLTKIATEFISAHENVVTPNFSFGPILDQILREICVQASSSATEEAPSSGKLQYRLKPELLAEYCATSMHLTRKQHEAAHENWFQERLRRSKAKEDQLQDEQQSTWLEFPLVNIFLPCAMGFQCSRWSILQADVCRLIYEVLWRASTDAHTSLTVLSKAIHLFTLQLYVVEEIRYQTKDKTTPTTEEQDAIHLMQAFMEQMTSAQPSLYSVSEPRESMLALLLKLNPWSSASSLGAMVRLDGDQKHEIGRGMDWLIHRLSRLSGNCQQVVHEHQRTRRMSQDEQDRKQLLAQRKKEAQLRAIQAMQQRQAAFAEQMKQLMKEEMGSDDDDTQRISGSDTSTTNALSSSEMEVTENPSQDVVMDEADAIPECAMCHSIESEESFMCLVGFAQSSAVVSRPNTSTAGRFLSTPMDEMHVGEDVPVHVRLCGHAVHHNCWESYHASQFQRAITGGQHRHGLNAVDVTKKEFLCPLCKTISNILIPTMRDDMMPVDSTQQETTAVDEAMLQWLEDVTTASDSGSSVVSPPPSTIQTRWLEDGLSSLCMAVHKVACGAMQKSRPERYSTSACLALFHTLLCTMVSPTSATVKDQLKPEQRFLQAMQLLPQMLSVVAKPKPGSLSSQTSLAQEMKESIRHLLYYGGSDVTSDGVVVLEDDHPSTQTQTRKQSQWNKVRRPVKPLLLSHLGTILVKGALLAASLDEATYVARLLVTARLVQTLLWEAICRKDHELVPAAMTTPEATEENVELLVHVLFPSAVDVHDPTVSATRAAQTLVVLRRQLLSSAGDRLAGTMQPVDDPVQLLQLVANEVVPMLRIATFLLQYKRADRSPKYTKPTFVRPDDVVQLQFTTVDAMVSGSPRHVELMTRWIQRFTAAYDEMVDPNSILQQWLTTTSAESPQITSLEHVVRLDLNTHFVALSVYGAGAERTSFLRSLPRAYVKFYSELAKRKCDSCHQFPSRPAVCLLCGMLLCAANTCPSVHLNNGYPDESNPGACTVHAKKCGRGTGLFLLVLEGAVLLVYWKLAAYVPSLYVDAYGEEFGERNRELNKGRPLYLNEDRRERLLRLWLRHEIPSEVVKIQNSSERVIRNSHY